jgi:hypothetical protein
MVAPTSELIVEILRRAQADFDDVNADVGEIHVRAGSLETRMAHTDVRLAETDPRMAELSFPKDRRDERMERILRCLALSDTPQ